MLKIYAAPLQGFTEAAWRNVHNTIFGGVEAYVAPFARIERGEIRAKDVRDIAPENNSVPRLIPQLLAATPCELSRLADLFASMGYAEADINMGCPHPPVTGKRRGSGLLPHPDMVAALLAELPRHPDLKFSVKMRLGLEDANEWRQLMPILNEATLQCITLHPRIGRQQYRGEVDIQVFSEFYEACQHPLVYNGDIQSVEDIRRLESLFPRLEGVMVGRGLLARPSLAVEYSDGCTTDTRELFGKVAMLHDQLFNHYTSCLQGDAQLLGKLKPHWEYLLPDADKKARKAIKKATRLDKYLSAVNALLSNS